MTSFQKMIKVLRTVSFAVFLMSFCQKNNALDDSQIYIPCIRRSAGLSSKKLLSGSELRYSTSLSVKALKKSQYSIVQLRGGGDNEEIKGFL